MLHKFLSFLLGSIFVLVIFVAGVFWGQKIIQNTSLTYPRSGFKSPLLPSSSLSNLSTVKPTTPSPLPTSYCATLSPDGFYIIPLDDMDKKRYQISGDINHDGVLERLVFYKGYDYDESGCYLLRAKNKTPIVIDLLTGPIGCPQKPFNAAVPEGNFNAVLDVKFIPNFLTTNQGAFAFRLQNNTCSSASVARLFIITLINGQYRMIQGPQIRPDLYYDFVGNPYPGQTLIIASPVTSKNEAYFSAHRYKLEKYVFDPVKLIYVFDLVLGTTTNKYDADLYGPDLIQHVFDTEPKLKP